MSTPHVLHLIDSEDPSGSPPALELLATLIRYTPEVSHAVHAVGGPEFVRHARGIGLNVQVLSPAPSLLHPAAWLGLARRLKCGNPALIHTLSLRAASLAALFTPDTPRLATISASPRRPDRLARLALAETAFIPTDTATRDALIASGVSETRCAAAEPPIDRARLSVQDRRAARLALGVKDDSTLIVAALGDPPGVVDALLAMLGTGLAREAGRDLRLLVGPHASGLSRATRVIQSAGRSSTLVVHPSADLPWASLPLCDVALTLTPGLSCAWAMAAGLPIVAPDAPAFQGVLSDGETALFFPPNLAGRISRLLCRLADDPGLAQRLGAAAQDAAAHRHDPRRFAAAWASAAERVAGRALTVHPARQGLKTA